MMLVCEWVNLKLYLWFLALYFIINIMFIYVTESLIVLLIIIKIVLYVVIIKIFFTFNLKKDYGNFLNIILCIKFNLLMSKK